MQNPRPAALVALALSAPIAALVAAPVAAQSGWAVTSTPQARTAAMLIGQPEAANAFRLDCSAKGTSLTTWTRRPPRNVTEGEFPTRMSVFQGQREIVIGSTGRVLPAGGTRIDGLIADPEAFLTGMANNSRLVVVTFAGRATAPAPTAATLEQFRKACAATR